LKESFTQTKVLLRSVPGVIFGLYLVALVLMNLLANKSIVNLPYLALDCGIFVSWMIFMVMDLTTKYFGVKAANMLTVVGLFLNLLLSLILLITGSIDGLWSEVFTFEGSETAVNAALDNTFKGNWLIILGSSLSFAVSAVVNNVLNGLIGRSVKTDNFFTFALRSYASTFIGQFVDNMLFATVISIGLFGWTFAQCAMCALTGAVVELLFEVVFSPIGYRVLRSWERAGVGKEYLDLIGGGSK
ncbi:MAG: VUT family protein, partial [Clostridia bacterium]|nr:VUT family protein [Clostridia bacterium]